jgi:elongator complex protein 3
MRAKFKNTLYQFPTSIDLWEEYRALVADGSLSKQPELERILRVKDVRTNSGIAPITVLTKPYPCPGKCVYCPTEARMPKSYISSEPAAARALSLKFDPYEQVVQRVETLERNGHEAKKIELIVKGGTWSSYRWEYRLWFITRCYEAANDLKEGIGTEYEAREVDAETPRVFQTRLKPQSETSTASSAETLSIEEITSALVSAQHINETSAYRIIGLTIETRPDWVTAEEIIRLRQLGCTRVELGVQTLQDDVLELTQRGHTIEATIRATALLKQAGFKTDFHILPGQPGSTPQKDLEDFQTLFSDPRYRPDMIKLYPCVVLPTAELHEWTKRGEFTPLEGDTLKELLISMQELVPRYCRISRLIRDFPESDISYGNKITNLRETLETEMNKRGIHCQCLRCREVGHVKNIDPSKVTPQLFEETYDNAGGREIFITMEDPDRRAVFAFLRLRLPNAHNNDSELTDPKFVRESKKITEAFPLFRETAFVRELHTYGTALDLAQTHTNASQHKGYGRLLMQHAETIARKNNYPTLAVISGIGVREYYRSLGYTEQETYMVKKLV